MVFKVLLHPNAAKALKKLDGANRERMRKVLGELEVDPWKAGKQLHLSDFRSMKGDCRAIYETDADQKQVTVRFIGHRKKVYDDFTKMF